MSRILFDGPNIAWRSLLAGKDDENGREVDDPAHPGKKIYCNGWLYGYENCLTLMLAALERYGFAPRDVVLVMEKPTSLAWRFRRTNDDSYKANRKGRAPEIYAEFKKMVEALEKFWLDLGAAVVRQELVEADDILAHLALHAESPTMVFSHDGDLVRLVGTNPKGVMISVGNNDALNTNPYGPFPVEGITVYKALVGDRGDNIKGAHGFGDAKFLEMLAQYGVEVLEEIENLILSTNLEALEDDIPDFKHFRKITEDKKAVYTSYAFAQLYPDAVNTLEAPLEWQFGMVRDWKDGDDPRFRKWYGTRLLVHAGNLNAALSIIEDLRSPFVALDLETTTCEESDEWQAAKKKREGMDGIDVLGQEIVSCGITLGRNLNHTFYFTHRHLAEEGIEQLTLEQLGSAVQQICEGKRVAVHNAAFELSVLYTHFGEGWKDNGHFGFLPNVHDTRALASYVDENLRANLKFCAQHYLGYKQQTYEEVTAGRKMDQLTATEAFHYGTDDTLVTAALYNHLSHICELEDTWKVFQYVEPLPQYLTAYGFVKGTPLNYQAILDFSRDDDKAYEAAWPVVRQYLIDHGWSGTEVPQFDAPFEVSDAKLAFETITGEPLDTKVRKPEKVLEVVLAKSDEYVASLFEAAYAGELAPLNALVKARFKGEPELNLGSPKQVNRLLYEAMGMPVRVRNKPTDAMKARGKFVGTPSTNELAIRHAIHFDAGEALRPVLEALLTMRSVETRRKLYYEPYRYVRHWKDNLVHASFMQNAAATRRYACMDPNLQQLPKRGEGVRFREALVPHHEDALVVSLDFEAQELRLTADDSGDENMLSCYIGDKRRDMHAITGAALSERAYGRRLTYEQLEQELDSDDDEVRGQAKEARALGKKLNFTALYGAQELKVAQTLLVSEDDARAFLQAREKAFPGIAIWRDRVVMDLKEKGYATTKLGARRHLRSQLRSPDFKESNKAERQGPNFRIQGSGAEMTKLAMRSMWRRGIFFKYDARPIGPIHDEFVSSVAIKDIYGFIKEKHACMVQPYGNMRVPVVSSISFGPSFGEQIEIGTEATDEAIAKGLEKLAINLRRAA